MTSPPPMIAAATLLLAAPALAEPNRVAFPDILDGAVYRLFVLEKGAGWGDEYDVAVRTGDRQFQWYWPDGSVNMAENTERCRACHQSREGREFMYTFNEARSFE